VAMRDSDVSRKTESSQKRGGGITIFFFFPNVASLTFLIKSLLRFEVEVQNV
jgi:hypothetical protein